MTLILFIVSLFILCLLIILKAFELKFSKTNFISSVLTKNDEKVQGLVNFVVFKYNRYKKISRIFIFDFTPSYTFEQVSRLKNYLSNQYNIATEDFRGRRVLQNTGSASFFLERLSDDKSKIDGRNI